MTPALRKAVLLLLAAVLAVAPLVPSFGATANANCLFQQEGLPDGGCCGETPASPACDMVCAMGASACMTSAAYDVTIEHRSVSPSQRASASLASQTRAPDTAPPKPLSA